MYENVYKQIKGRILLEKSIFPKFLSIIDMSYFVK